MKKQQDLRSLVFMLSALSFGACGGGSDSPSDSSSISIVLKSSQLSPLILSSFLRSSNVNIQTGTSCNVTIDTSSTSGTCYTPTEVSGAFNKAQLATTSMGMPVRILGGGRSAISNIFGHASFNLNTSPSSEGEDNIEDGNVSSYNFLQLNTQFIEFAFTATSSNKVYRVRTFFVNNIPSTESTLSAPSCRISTNLSEADSVGTLFSNMAAQSGDIMVCIKNTATETCQNSDYSWVDASGNLSSSRPGSPKQQSGTNLMTATSCPSDGADWGYGSLNLGFPSALEISASIDRGTKKYTSGSKTGTQLTFTLDVLLTQALFVPSSTGISDLATATESAVLSNIDEIMLKSMYVSKHRTTASAGDTNSMLSATPSITIE